MHNQSCVHNIYCNIFYLRLVLNNLKTTRSQQMALSTICLLLIVDPLLKQFIQQNKGLEVSGIIPNILYVQLLKIRYGSNYCFQKNILKNLHVKLNSDNTQQDQNTNCFPINLANYTTTVFSITNQTFINLFRGWLL